MPKARGGLQGHRDSPQGSKRCPHAGKIGVLSGTQSNGGQCYLNVTLDKTKMESLDIIILGTILVYCQQIIVLFDLGCTYPYVLTSYAVRLELSSQCLSMLVCVATLMGDYLEVDLIYRS